MKFLVTVTWEATAELKVEASSADAAEAKVRARGLPWNKAIVGDDDHYWLEVNEAQEKTPDEIRRSSVCRRSRQSARR